MLLEDWSERLPVVCDFLLASGFLPETVHLEKNIGVLLSAGTEKCAEEALEIYRRDMEGGIKARRAARRTAFLGRQALGLSYRQKSAAHPAFL